MKKIITLALIMVCVSQSYGMETEKDTSPGSDCLFGRYSVWEIEPNGNENSDKQNAIPYALLSQLIAEPASGGAFLAFFLILVQTVTQ
jgi:hypothetical protein